MFTLGKRTEEGPSLAPEVCAMSMRSQAHSSQTASTIDSVCHHVDPWHFGELQWLQKQASFLATFYRCPDLGKRKDFSPSWRKSSKKEGAAVRQAARRTAQGEPPPGRSVLSHQGSGNLACMNCLATATRLSFCQAHLQIA